MKRLASVALTALSLAMLAGCSAPSPAYRAMIGAADQYHAAVAPEHLAYVDADDSLTETDKLIRRMASQEFRAAIDAAEREMEAGR